MLNVILDKITRFHQDIQMNAVNKTVSCLSKLRKVTKTLSMPLRREMLFVPSLLDRPRENQIDHLPPTLRNLICTLLKQSGHVNEIEAIMHFLMHEDQSNIVLWLKAKLLRKKKVSFASTHQAAD